MRNAWWALALVASALPRIASADVPAPTMPVETLTLDNGLKVILHKDDRTPITTVNIWYHVGSKDEPAGRNGFAHLFEHVMFQGSKHVPEDTYFKSLERVGASGINGSTDLDRTNYYETVPSNQLELALWLESDRMGFLLDHTDQATFASQREVVKNERRQNYENRPYGLVPQFIWGAVFPEGHPYHRLTIGTPADLDAATLDDVKAFFRTFYVPNNATLVVAGDIDRDKTIALVKKYFEPIVRGKEPPTVTKPQPVTLSGETRLAVEAEVELPRLVIAWPTPPAYAPGDGELDMVSHVLSAGKSSRLYKRLVYDLQIAQAVSASQQSSQLASVYQISITLKKGTSLADARAIVDEEIDKLRSSPPTSAELDRAKADTLAELVFGLERGAARADDLNRYDQMTGTPDFLAKDIARYSAITPEGVQKAVTDYLPKDKRVVLTVTPTPGAPRAGRLVGGAK
jgi:predicted Zn-dependent peptidase